MSIYRIYSKFSGKNASVPVPYMITVSARRSASSGVSVIGRGINKTRKLWNNKIFSRVNTDGM